MTETISDIIKNMNLTFIDEDSKRTDEKSESKTSLCALLFNGGCLVYSDMQATTGMRYRSSTRETKIYQMGDDRVVLAGTGSVDGIIRGQERAYMVMQSWKRRNEWRDVPPQVMGEILRGVMSAEGQACFLMGAFDYQTGQGIIADVFESGNTWKTDLSQVHGSGTYYMLGKANDVARKALLTVNSEVITTDDVYEVLPKLKFGKEVAMLEGLDIISAGPESDVFSGGAGYQLMVVEESGVSEYIISRELAGEILDQKKMAELSAYNPEIKAKQFRNYKKMFESARRR